MPKDDEYDDEGTRIWISMATECRLVLSHVVGERSQKSADLLIKRTAQCLNAMPLFVTDGLKFYKIALLKQYMESCKALHGPANEDDRDFPG